MEKNILILPRHKPPILWLTRGRYLYPPVEEAARTLSGMESGRRWHYLRAYFIRSLPDKRRTAQSVSVLFPHVCLTGVSVYCSSKRQGLCVRQPLAFSLPGSYSKRNERECRFQRREIIHRGQADEFLLFRQNYYWFLSDYRDVAIDSRHLGIIPEDHIIGRIFFCWYSPDKNNRFTLIK